MKFSSDHSPAPGAALCAAESAPAPGGESRTRDAVARLIQQAGPQTAAVLADRLQLSAAAVRRHLEALVADGVLVEVAPRATSRGPRGRGRPARAFALTDLGRARFGHSYDELATTALQYLRSAGGEQAVVGFAEHRAAGLAEHIRLRLAGRPLSPAGKAELVAEVLTEEGYVANVAPGGAGSQLCQHHCPIVHVAAEFPELCEAETRVLAEVLGTNVQRLATIAHGDGVCTTHISPPLPASPSVKPATGTSSKARTSTTGGRQ